MKMSLKKQVVFGVAFIAMWAFCTWLALTLGSMV